jgi:hypothetical protein
MEPPGMNRHVLRDRGSMNCPLQNSTGKPSPSGKLLGLKILQVNMANMLRRMLDLSKRSNLVTDFQQCSSVLQNDLYLHQVSTTALSFRRESRAVW